VWSAIAVEGATWQMMLGNGYGFNWKGLYVTSLIDKLHGWELRANELSETTKVLTTLGVYIKKYHGSHYYGKAMNITRRLIEAYDAELAKYDLLLMPPGFPLGGMENPRLTFLTPTILAGDKSLVSLIAHELAHSWSGNLVTNATWDDFWMNEGFTVYFENRIMEALYGKPFADMQALLGLEDLKETVADLGDTSADTHLKLNLEGRIPRATAEQLTALGHRVSVTGDWSNSSAPTVISWTAARRGSKSESRTSDHSSH